MPMPRGDGSINWHLFFSRFDMTDGCWEWRGCKNADGYGYFSYGGHRGRKVRAHRISFEFFNGPLPKNLHACHRCDNPGCVNPAHLFAGDNFDNMRDAIVKGRIDRSPKPKDTASPNAKITAVQAAEIRRRYAAGGITHRQLSQEYGICESAVSRYLSRTVEVQCE